MKNLVMGSLAQVGKSDGCWTPTTSKYHSSPVLLQFLELFISFVCKCIQEKEVSSTFPSKYVRESHNRFSTFLLF